MKRILVVDDEPDLVAALASILKSEGYEVYASREGHDALDQAQRLQPDLVILDYLMPGLNGAAVGDRLRADTQTQRIKILMSSSLTEASVRARFAGYDAYAHKPWDMDATLSVIADLVEN